MEAAGFKLAQNFREKWLLPPGILSLLILERGDSVMISDRMLSILKYVSKKEHFLSLLYCIELNIGRNKIVKHVSLLVLKLTVLCIFVFAMRHKMIE